MMWDAAKKDWVPAKGKPAAHAAARVPDPAAPVSRDAEGYQTSMLPTLRSEDELAAYQKDLEAKAKVQRYAACHKPSALLSWASVIQNGIRECAKEANPMLPGRYWPAVLHGSQLTMSVILQGHPKACS